MSYWDENDTKNRLGYNVDDSGKIAKYSRLNDYYDNSGNKNYVHGHEVLDTATGVSGYRGENASKEEFRRDFDDAKFSRYR